MNIEDFRNYCLSLPEAKESMPWTDPQYQNLITFTIAGKWFCGIEPAWHMNKKHWIKLVLDSDVPAQEIKTLVKQAYDLIVASLTQSKLQELGLQ